MNIIISGITCSGKTTLSNSINGTIMHEDDYMKDRNQIPRRKSYLLMDLPSAYHLDEFVCDANTLLTTGKANYPNYDVSNNRRINKNGVIQKSEINVFEGLHTIDTLKDLRDSIKVFIDTDLSTCLERRIKRDSELYGISEEEVIKYFNEIILNIYKTHIEKQKYMSDIILDGGEDVKCLLKKLQI